LYVIKGMFYDTVNIAGQGIIPLERLDIDGDAEVAFQQFCFDLLALYEEVCTVSIRHSRALHRRTPKGAHRGYSKYYCNLYPRVGH